MNAFFLLPGLLLNIWLVIYSYDNDWLIFLIALFGGLISAGLFGWLLSQNYEDHIRWSALKGR